MKSYSYIFILCLLVTSSCKGVLIENKNITEFSVGPSVGYIGSGKKNLFSKSFIESGTLVLDEKIRLIVAKKKMARNNYVKITKNIPDGSERVRTKDSAEVSNYFYRINISDKVGLLNELNKPINHELKEYLEVTQNKTIVTSVDIFFPLKYSVKLDEAQEIYLINKYPGSYSLELVKGEGTEEIIHFNQGVILDYNYSAFCWTEDYKGKLKIAALRDPKKPCPGETVKSPAEIEREDLFESLR